jgi:hypothetical protein
MLGTKSHQSALISLGKKQFVVHSGGYSSIRLLSRLRLNDIELVNLRWRSVTWHWCSVFLSLVELEQTIAVEPVSLLEKSVFMVAMRDVRAK